MKLVIEQLDTGQPYVYDAEPQYDYAATLRAQSVYACLEEARRELQTGIRSPRRGYIFNMARRIVKEEAAARAAANVRNTHE